MDVLVGAIGVEKKGVLREMGHQAQLDLRVVGRHQHVARGCDKCSANLATDGGADRNVLQIGVGGRKTAGRRADLIEGGVDATV